MQIIIFFSIFGRLFVLQSLVGFKLFKTEIFDLVIQPRLLNLFEFSVSVLFELLQGYMTIQVLVYHPR